MVNAQQLLTALTHRTLRGKQLFRRGLKTYERCSECNLLFQRDYGDTLMFMIITDRIPMLEAVSGETLVRSAAGVGTLDAV